MRLGCGLKILPRRSLILKTVNTECMVNFAVHLIEGGKDQKHAQIAGNAILGVFFFQNFSGGACPRTPLQRLALAHVTSQSENEPPFLKS